MESSPKSIHTLHGEHRAQNASPTEPQGAGDLLMGKQTALWSMFLAPCSGSSRMPSPRPGTYRCLLQRDLTCLQNTPRKHVLSLYPVCRLCSSQAVCALPLLLLSQSYSGPDTDIVLNHFWNTAGQETGKEREEEVKQSPYFSEASTNSPQCLAF